MNWVVFESAIVNQNIVRSPLGKAQARRDQEASVPCHPVDSAQLCLGILQELSKLMLILPIPSRRHNFTVIFARNDR